MATKAYVTCVELRCLGPLEVRGFDGIPIDLGGPQQRLVFALLLVHANEVVSTDRIIDSVWGESPPDTARKTIQGYVSALRKVLPAGSALESRPPGYLLQVKPHDVDSDRFEQLAAEGATKVTSDPHHARELLEEALSLWRGRPYQDLADADALRPSIVRLEQIYATALETRIAADLFAGQATAVLAELEDLTTRYPLRERLWALRMLALYRVGRQADALRAGEEERRILAEEVGLEPGPELRLLEQRILEQNPILGTLVALELDTAATDAARRNPYKGLRAFEEADAGDFFGRTTLVRRLCESLSRRRNSRLVVLAGPSGSGKSSVVRAGLIPELRNAATDVAVIYPGSTPTATLSAATERLDQDRKSVVVVDQLEELFTLPSQEDRAEFLDTLTALATAPGGPWLLVIIRADFMDRLLAQPRFAALIEPGLVLVTPLEDHEVREVVVGPASRLGVAVEPDLVAAAVSQVAHRPSVLPLLQFALTDLYERVGGQTMTLAALEAAGGIAGALVRRAEEIYERLEPTDRETIRQVLLRLVTVTENGEPLRHRVLAEDLQMLPGAANVIAQCGEHRLLIFDRSPDGKPTVEVAHEVLLREWPRLARWINEARDTLRRYRQLAEAASDWETHDRADGFLLSDSRLARFADRSNADLALSQSAETFLTASRDAEAERCRGQRRKRRLVLAGFGAAAVIALVLAVAALLARNDAESSAARAQAEAQTAFANELSAAALLAIDDDPELAILLSLQSLATNPTADVSLDHKTTLRQAMEADILVARHTVAAPGELLGMDLAPDGSSLAYWNPGELHLVDAATWTRLWTYSDEAFRKNPFAPANLGTPVFSPDGRLVAIGTFEESPRLVVLDSATGAIVEQVEFADAECGAHTSPQAWSADGRFLGVHVDVDCEGPRGESIVRILDTETWESAVDIPAFGQVVFAEKAPRMAVIEYPNGFPGRKTFIYETETFEVIAEVGGTSGDLHPGGETYAAADPDGQQSIGSVVVDLYDVGTGRVTDRFTGMANRPMTHATDFIRTFDGHAMIVGTDGQTTGLWNAQTGGLIRFLPTGEVNSLGYDETSQLLYTAGTNGTISVWDFSPGGQMAPENLVLPYWFEANWFSVNPESRTAVAMHWGTPSEPIQSFAVFDTVTGSLEETMVDEIAHKDIVALPDGRVFYLEGDQIASTAGPYAVWDAATGAITDFVGCAMEWDDWLTPAQVPPCIGSGTPFRSTGPMVISADGTELMAGDVEGVVHIWNTSTLEKSATLDIGDVASTNSQVVAAGEDWILLRDHENGVFVAVDRTTVAPVGEFEFDFAGDLNPELARDGSFLLLRSFDTSVYRVETDWWVPRLLYAPGQFVRGLALSPGADQLMLGGTDGFVRIVDASSGQLLDQIPFEHVSDGHWLDNNHIVVGTGSTGTWGMLTLDFDEVVHRAADQLTRSFTDEECRIYRIDPCPTLEEAQSGA